jgi:spermidine/putrescine-binding protein
MTGATVIVYDTTQIKTPLTSWTDLYKPEYAGKLAIGDISGTSGLQFLLALNRMKGGSLTNVDPGFEAIKPLAKNSVTLYTQADQIVSLFERKEIAVAVWYPDRADRPSTRACRWRWSTRRKAPSASCRPWSFPRAPRIRRWR